MSNTIVGILGLLTIVAIVVTLFKSKTQPAIAFIVWPTILALVLVIGGRHSFDDIAAMIKSGFSSTGPTAALFVFSVPVYPRYILKLNNGHSLRPLFPDIFVSLC